MKVALVTGGSKGIGQKVCLALANDNTVIAVGFHNDSAGAEKTVEIITQKGLQAFAVHIDITSSESVDSAFSEIEKEHGIVSILVNNAGITEDNILPRMSEDEWDNVLNTNLKGGFRTTKRAIKGMIKNKWGRIIYISSIVGIYGNAGQSNYASSKAGIIGFAKSISKEVGSRNITSNVVAPGYIETDMTSTFTEEQKEVILDKISIKRIGKGEDIANIVSFLASNESEYITGQVLKVDGGLVL